MYTVIQRIQQLGLWHFCLFVVVGLHIVKDSFHNSLVTFFNRLLLDGFVRVLFRFGWFVVVVVVGWT